TITAIQGYGALFSKAFGTSDVTLDKIAIAISDFERTLMSGNSKYDKGQFTDLEQRGLDIFNDRECHICHKAPAFTDDLFHNSGVAFKNGKIVDEGRFGFTKLNGHEQEAELGAF